jgi:hypothetical protein
MVAVTRGKNEVTIIQDLNIKRFSIHLNRVLLTSALKVTVLGEISLHLSVGESYAEKLCCLCKSSMAEFLNSNLISFMKV